MSLLEMSLMGGAMVLCILLLRRLTRGRLPEGLLSAMWTAVILRLLVPVEIPSALSIAGLIKQAGQVTAMTLSARPVSNPVSVPPLALAWLYGAAFCGIFFLIIGIRQRRALRMALPASMTRELKEALAGQRLLRAVAVFTSDRIATPLTYGIIKPRIVLPSHVELTGDQLTFVMAHECSHIRRHDALKKLILLAAVCLHWFNPLIWLMAAVCRRDMELNCDRQVLKTYGPQMRAAYARTLLGLEERKRFSGVLMECFSISPLEERIRSIMMGRKTTMAGVLATVIVFVCASAVFATSPGAQATITANTVWISSAPLAAYDVREMQATGIAVYAWDGNVLTAGQPGISILVPDAELTGQVTAGTFAKTAASVSVGYGSAAVVSDEYAAVPALPVPVYSMTYTIQDGGI